MQMEVNAVPPSIPSGVSDLDSTLNYKIVNSASMRRVGGAYIRHNILEPSVLSDELFEPVSDGRVGIF